MHKTYAENICIVGHHPTFQNQPRLHPQVMHQIRAYLQSLSTQADIMSRGPASTDIAYHKAINMNVWTCYMHKPS